MLGITTLLRNINDTYLHIQSYCTNKTTNNNINANMTKINFGNALNLEFVNLALQISRITSYTG